MTAQALCIRVLGAIGVLAAFGVAPSAQAQRAGEVTTTFDPRSGRFGGELGAGSRTPDTLEVSADRLWSALPGAYAELGVPLTVVDSAAHSLGSQAVSRRPVGGLRLSRILECGTGSYGPNAERYTVQLTVLSAVQPVDAKRSVLITRVGGTAAPNGLNSSVKCESNGALEDRLVSILRTRLAH